jgi:hypothetical protein
VDGLRLYLDEVGWQVDTTHENGYTGDENVPVTDDETQAEVYGELVRQASCDPDVAQVNIFGFRDDALRTGFQAGLYRVDGTARPSAAAVRDAIADPACTATLTVPWRPARAVLGAKAPVLRVTPGEVAVDLTAAEAASARVCLLPGARTLSHARRAMAARFGAALGCVSTLVAQNRWTTVHLARPAGPQTVAVRLAAETNPARSTTAVRPVR